MGRFHQMSHLEFVVDSMTRAERPTDEIVRFLDSLDGATTYGEALAMILLQLRRVERGLA